jgi:hypothetical protein
MSTIARYGRPGLLERLTSSTAFAVLLGIATVVLAPVVLLGVMVLSGSLLDVHAGLGHRLFALLPYGGLVGYVGLFRARRPPMPGADYWTTLICLGIGIATCGTVIGGLVAMSVAVDLERAGSFVVLSLPIAAALGRIARLRRLRAAAEGRVPDSLPLIFLTVALGEALCAIAIGVQLAIAG